jgi:membrane protein required for colicin V production
LNWLDITLAFVVLLSVFNGLRKGLSREIIGLAASIFALVLAAWFYRTAGAQLQQYVSSQWVASLAGFLIIFFAVILLGALLSAVVSGFLKTVGLSPIDRVLGAAFGLARGLLFGFLVVTVLIAFLPSEGPGQLPKAVLQSQMAPYLIQLSHVVAPLAPQGLKDSFEQRYRQVRQYKQATWEKKADS